jgi:PucR C-terminal helix-turn-helix domain/GGDEF-like domain
LTLRKGSAASLAVPVTLSAPTAPPAPAPAAPVGALHARTALVALALVREAPGTGGGAALLRALRERPGADAAGLLADRDDARALAQGAIALCAQQPDRASWVVPTIVEQFPAALSLQEDGVAWALLPARAGDDAGRATTAAARRVAARLGGRTAVGLSPFVSSPDRLHDALRQARIALELTRGGEVGVEEATTGTWRLLLAMALHDPAELASCVTTSIGPALEHDARLRTEVVPTFRAYLRHGANMNATAAAIHAHRHTVGARLERLAVLTRLDPTRHDDRERLGVGVKARLLLDALARAR